MRQAGVLAAAGLIALEQSPEQLPQDHANAKLLAQASRPFPASRSIPTSSDEYRHLRCFGNRFG